jgi:hypothetical protein
MPVAARRVEITGVMRLVSKPLASYLALFDIPLFACGILKGPARQLPEFQMDLVREIG